jgi:hypothetical protein
MPKFRKKPVTVHAKQFKDQESAFKIIQWAAKHGVYNVSYEERLHDNNHMLIPTLEGEMRADIGDWIIKGVGGEFYPCKPDIFEKTYEKVN